ncbi:hypothetical protein PC9H_000612 [Pleurotus ostreatus]|uniref:UDP-galactose transporter n=1 Tax=Pleurotus ostreatus TaxID=5322 RepID=A0A8H7A288_PLEOS|nr:uncharacterized protein PC9H_000612 [Pleurotus ostreatus]KAF7440268.1 hypothetical protein PC9H_000612 [Pleurotus ostreatus]KAJ8700436.1 hypothetical protein PTI98_003459 [Pleurotus ostreatus]
MYHRPYPTVRQGSSSGSVPTVSQTHTPSPRPTPLLPPSPPTYSSSLKGMSPSSPILQESPSGPTIFGMPLKYVSLVTLAVQNAALSIVMHYSRVSTPPSRSYSPAAAVLLNEVLKGSISFVIALWRVYSNPSYSYPPTPASFGTPNPSRQRSSQLIPQILYPFFHVCSEVFSPDCWKLSIPAILYVIQNSLQFVAISNLPVATFQVTYQMKILTTAAFSVALLRKRLGPTKWLSLFFLAMGVGIVQLQTATGPSKPNHVGSAHDSAPLHIHIMNPLKGFAAVTAACFTSGLAGVYFEMVLKGSKADLWVRNVQLSLFSLIPALLPIFYSNYSHSHVPGSPHEIPTSFLQELFKHFGPWAWATVSVQVFGGLVTAIVIKYSDNILKGFATSLSIVLSFLASVALFDFSISPGFVIGSSTVLIATWMYNQPGDDSKSITVSASSITKGLTRVVSSASLRGGKVPSPFPGSPLDIKDPILGELPGISRKKSSPFGSPRAMASALGLGLGMGGQMTGNGHPEMEMSNGMLETPRYMEAPYGSPYNSRPPSRAPSPLPPSPLGSDA